MGRCEILPLRTRLHEVPPWPLEALGNILAGAIRSLDRAPRCGDDAAGVAMAWADGGGHPTFLPRYAGVARRGGEVARGWMPRAAEVTVMSAMHSLI
jgi:hypothetical protein